MLRAERLYGQENSADRRCGQLYPLHLRKVSLRLPERPVIMNSSPRIGVVIGRQHAESAAFFVRVLDGLRPFCRELPHSMSSDSCVFSAFSITNKRSMTLCLCAKRHSNGR
jgi:hypothetical protein